MKTNILSLLALAGLITFAGCANDDTANKQTEQEPETEGLTSFVEEDRATRTTGEYDGSGLNFYWTAGDRLWVNNGTLIQDSKNNINSKLENNPTNPTAVKRVAKAKFWFSGTYTASSYPVRYTGKNGTADKVTIKASQSQSIPNDASHIGEDGDCGVAQAQKQSDGKYHFTLDHKAAYITFMPYTNQNAVAKAKIQKIRVYTSNTSDALAGTFDLADDGTLSNPTSTSNSVELDVNEGIWNGGFSIPNTPTYTTNGVTMVVNPGTYSNVSIEYTLYAPVTHAVGTITKTYPSVTFTAGRNKKVKTNLQVPVYPYDVYYMWDAQQQYWYGHESSQPKTENPGAPSDNSWPQSKAADPDRWYNEVQGYTDPTGTAPAVLPTTSRCQACPNINELCWYVQEGDPHWDKELWATMDYLYTGGIWLRKQSVIAAAQSPSKTVADLKAAAPNGIDYTRSTNQPSYSNSSISSGKPSNLNDYFYLPALGYYYIGGALNGVGIYAYYWSSTPYPSSTNNAYILDFTSSEVKVNHISREYGFRLWTAQ